MTLEQIEAELANIAEQIRPLTKRREELTVERRRLLSKRFIDANRVKLGDVELSREDGKPYFKTFLRFADWMKANNVTKRFCEWNERIYFTSEIIAGRMDEDAPASIRELTEMAKKENDLGH